MGRENGIKATRTLSEMLRAQKKLRKPHSALITDIDNTFYRSGHRAAEVAAWELNKRANTAPYPIIAVTGNSFEHVRRRIENGELPVFQAVVGDVGTDMWLLESDGTFTRDQPYQKRLSGSGYNRRDVVQAARLLLPFFRKHGIRMQFQAPEKEAAYLTHPSPDYLPYKVSLHFFGDDEAVELVQAIFENQFKNQKIVICEEIHHNAMLGPAAGTKKYCLDILAATKADAVNYLIKQFDLRQGVVAGDSGNDVSMLLETPDNFAAVAVGGHKPELRTALETAKTGKPVFIDTDKTRMAAQTLLLFNDYLCGGPLPSSVFEAGLPARR